MSFYITKLTSEHTERLQAFSCTETKEELAHYKSDERRRIIRHSKEMEDFLKEEALFEQDRYLNVTYLVMDDEIPIAYISLCNDSVRLEFDERDAMGYSYSVIPAVKIARLAVSNAYKNRGIGKILIAFAAYQCLEIRKNSGVALLTLDCYSHRVSYYEHLGFAINQIQTSTAAYDAPISMRIHLETFLERIADENIGELFI